ncbi:hypothetical protein PanWU01x14_301210, partial [Parasponia andersonii]
MSVDAKVNLKCIDGHQVRHGDVVYQRLLKAGFSSSLRQRIQFEANGRTVSLPPFFGKPTKFDGKIF